MANCRRCERCGGIKDCTPEPLCELCWAWASLAPVMAQGVIRSKMEEEDECQESNTQD
jgi:hypothetical protein